MAAKFTAEDRSKVDPVKPVKDFDTVVHEESNVPFNIPAEETLKDGTIRKFFKEIRQFKFGIFQGGVRTGEVVRSVASEYDVKKTDVKESDTSADLATLKAQVESEYKK